MERSFARSLAGDARYRHPRYDAERLYRTRTAGSRRRGGGTPLDEICHVRLRR